MEREEIVKEVLVIIASYFEDTWSELASQEAHLALRFQEDLGADSLDMIEICGEVEDAFDIFEDLEKEVGECLTIGDLVDLVERRLA